MTMTVQRQDIRCPHCGKKMGEALEGTYGNTCPRCKRWVTIVRVNGVDVVARAE
jgi:phage FluMu protein Com